MAWVIQNSPQELVEVAEGTPGSIPGPAPKLMPAYMDWLERLLSDYEALAKRLVKHRAEKGYIVESVVKKALCAVLPGRFTVGRGFAITASGDCSSQLDLVIYDGLFNAPIILEGGVGLFPIECIYGFVEVKSLLDGPGIDSAMESIGAVRSFAKEKRYVRYGVHDDGVGNKVVGEHELADRLAPRSFVFAINSAYADIQAVEAALKNGTETHSAHVHGLAVMEKDWFFHQRPYRKPHEFSCFEGQALAAFCASVLTSIQSVTMLPASMKQYLGLNVIE